MDAMYLLESLSRWIHVVAGIFWIGMLYFFNFVNANFAPTMDAETKKKVVPELMPRALYWFRWGAAFTWVTGVLILLIVFYHGRAALDAGREWSLGAFAMLILVFLAPFIYDLLYKAHQGSDHRLRRAASCCRPSLLFLYQAVGFGFRGYAIHLGRTFGTMMAFNVWFRIWPAQRSIITAIKNGQAPDAALVALAGTALEAQYLHVLSAGLHDAGAARDLGGEPDHAHRRRAGVVGDRLPPLRSRQEREGVLAGRDAAPVRDAAGAG